MDLRNLAHLDNDNKLSIMIDMSWYETDRSSVSNTFLIVALLSSPILPFATAVIFLPDNKFEGVKGTEGLGLSALLIAYIFVQPILLGIFATALALLRNNNVMLWTAITAVVMSMIVSASLIL